MATVRIPEQMIPEIAPKAAPDAYLPGQVSAEAFGFGTGRALQQIGAAAEKAGDVLSAHAVHFQQIQNETEVNDAVANRLGPGIRERAEKFYALSGKAAADAMPGATKDINDFRMQVRNGLANDAQRRAFDVDSMRRVESELYAMSRHAGAERKVWQKQTFESSVKNIADDAASRFNDPVWVNQNIGKATGVIQRFGEQNGWDDETIKQYTQHTTSHIQSQVVERLIQSNLPAAQAYYKNHAADFVGDDRLRIERDIRARSEHLAVMGRQMQSIGRQDAGIAIQNYAAMAKLGMAGEVPAELSRQNLAKLYPGDPKRVDNIVAQVEGLKMVSDHVSTLATKSTDDLDRERNAMMPKPGEPGFAKKMTALAETAHLDAAELKHRAAIAKETMKIETRNAFEFYQQALTSRDEEEMGKAQTVLRENLRFLEGTAKADQHMRMLAATEDVGRVMHAIRSGELFKGEIKADVLDRVRGGFLDTIAKLHDDDPHVLQRYGGLIANTIGQRNAALQGDFASYAITNRPEVKAAYEDYRKAFTGADQQQRASAAANYVRLMEIAQKDYGATGEAATKLLPAQDAAQLASMLKTQQENADATIQMRSMATAFGPAWPKVAHQIAKQSSELALLSEVNPQTADAAAIMRMANIPTAELHKQAASMDFKESDAERKVTSALSDFQASLPFDPQEYRTKADAVARLATYFVGFEKMSASSAVDRAANVVMGNYNFRPVNGSMLRIPKDKDASGHQIELAARGYQATLSGVDLEPDWKAYYPGLNEQQARAMKDEIVQSRAFPVTMGDHVQWFIQDAEKKFRIQPITIGGKPVVQTFEQLKAFTPRQPGLVDQPYYGSEGVRLELQIRKRDEK